jgi:predicted DsbA family dithiol-disulfide isomerase
LGGLEGLQLPLKEALFKAYFSDGGTVRPVQLAQIAQSVGLDRQRAERFWRRTNSPTRFAKRNCDGCHGVNSVPTVVFNGQYAVTGGNRWKPSSGRSGRS